MTKLVAILILWLGLCGCGGCSRGGEGMIEPDREFAVRPAASANPAPAPAPVAPEPAPPEPPPPATQPATAPYRAVKAPKVIETAVLQVNSSFITVQQVLHPLRRKLLALAKASQGDAATFGRAAAVLVAQETSNQVERALLLAEAEKRLTDPQRKFIDEEVNKIYRRALAETGGSKTAFLRLLRQEGTDLDTWHKDLWSALAIQAYGQQQFSSQIHITRPMMVKHYQVNVGKFRTEERVQMQIIAVPFETFLPEGGSAGEAQRREAVEKARARMKQATAALAGGEAFSDVARKHSLGPMSSAGGVWPMMARGSFKAEAVEAAAFDQRDGQVSKVIATAEGLYLVKTLTRRAGEQLPFEKVQDRVRDELRQQQFSRLRREYLARLRADATIVGSERFGEVAVATAARTYLRP